MSRKKSAEKRKEAYKKAVEHKMNSAAELVNGYVTEDVQTENGADAANRRNKRIVNRKLLLNVSAVLVQASVLILVVLAVFLPFRNSFRSVINEYFSSDKINFENQQLKEEYIGSTNEKNGVYYTDIQQPDSGTYYAEISCDFFSSRIYYGISDSALVSGVCQYSQSSLPGFGEPIMLYGYSASWLKGIDLISVGDELRISTNYGLYRYEVEKIEHFSNKDEVSYILKKDSESLIICTDYPFEEYKIESEDTYCVIASKVSGPNIAY